MTADQYYETNHDADRAILVPATQTAVVESGRQCPALWLERDDDGRLCLCDAGGQDDSPIDPDLAADIAATTRQWCAATGTPVPEWATDDMSPDDEEWEITG